MKGGNTFTMNQATMREAVQEYFDKRWTGAHQKVKNVSFGASFAGTFVVEIEETPSDDLQHFEERK